jgi:hypothetical protein
MKKFIAVFAAIVLLAALGVTAYKFGWLAKVGLSTAEGPGTGTSWADAPDAASAALPCRLTGAGVVPAGGWRRFSLLYAVPAGQSLSVQYRGFETNGTLKVR